MVRLHKKRKDSACNTSQGPLQPPTRKRQRVTLDQLKWSAVSVPENLNDYEGLYGLEEVDDVDIVKEDGRLVFHAKQGDSTRPNSLEQAKEDKTKEKEEDEDEDEEDEDEDEKGGVPWEGFSDNESHSSPQPDPEFHSTYQVQEQLPSKKNSKQTYQNTLHNTSFQVLEEEEVQDGVDVTAWNNLGLSHHVLNALSALAFTKPTAIQAAIIPLIVDGHDVIGKASTGSGKTLAYGIPIIESYLNASNTSKTSAMALILSPTRELAHQIAKHLKSFCSSSDMHGPRIASITGGLSIHKQERLLATAQIVVGTPGRLWELMSCSKSMLNRLRQVSFLVLDEADRLLTQGHFAEVDEILTALNKDEQDADNTELQSQPSRQTLVFSATFQKHLQQSLAAKKHIVGQTMDKDESMLYLMQKLSFREEKPKFIDVDPASQLAKGIKQGLVECTAMEKDLFLYALMLIHPRTRTLIFTNSISAVRRLTPFLQNLNLPAQALHSSMAQKARLRAVERFSDAESGILISTDVAARGLDIPGIQLIIHYHLPRTADMYVHRSGRTARADRQGGSIIICSPEEVTSLHRLIARLHVHTNEKNAQGIATLNVDRRLVSRLKPRAALAKRIADTALAKDKGRSDDNFFRNAAEELGIEYDSEELEKSAAGRQGRGNMRKAKERENRHIPKGEVANWKAQLGKLLDQHVNLGISENHLAQGIIDVDALLNQEKRDFLGSAQIIDFAVSTSI